MNKRQLLEDLGLSARNLGGFCGEWGGSGKKQTVFSPVDGTAVAEVVHITEAGLEETLKGCHLAFHQWKRLPAPKRGAIVKQLGAEVSANKSALARLVTLEMGKCFREALGEVQEMIDVFDFAVGLSRQTYGLTMPSERTAHRIQEHWHPLGLCAVITAFNFPMAVWSWNAALALVCGDSVLWKPSSKTPLSAIACVKMAERVLRRNGVSPAICSLAIGSGAEIGDKITSDERVALVSYTGSVHRGREVGKRVQARFGRHILELGGNNAVIVCASADLDVALRSVYFGAIGTAGQRCTSTRRVLVHESLYDDFARRLAALYRETRIGDPMKNENLMGPLVDTRAVDTMLGALHTIEQQGGRIVCGGNRMSLPGGCYVTPCLVEADNPLPIMKEETFAPVLYLMRFVTIEEAIAVQNDVPQGLSSAIITNDLRESDLFLSVAGSDCGIANVNTGTSGAEIGGAFGGEKETGGGRECGSDAWKAYMRRQTSTVNFSGKMELAQNVRLDI